MTDLTFITGNQHKADYLAKWLDMDVPHHKLDLDEIQSLDLRVVAEHKARQAFEVLRTPVLVEDVALTFTAMGKLPGTLVKWFLEDLGVEKMATLAHSLEHQKAIASICYVFFDGQQIQFFEQDIPGRIASAPRGDKGFGWNCIFIPDGSDKTFAEMDDETVKPFSPRFLAIEKLRVFLRALAQD
jgi:inosine triphosphate pyrophosphatase